VDSARTAKAPPETRVGPERATIGDLCKLVLCGDPNVRLCIVGSNGEVTNVAHTPILDSPVWSPDSSSIAYSVHDSTGTRREIKKLASAEPARVLLPSSGPLSFNPEASIRFHTCTEIENIQGAAPLMFV
jgi:hypothetical protein